MDHEQPAARLKRLEQILTRYSAPLSSGSEPAALHLESIPGDRIRQLTAELSGRTDVDDGFDGLIVKLLLNEYVGAVGHLRAVARVAAEHVDRAAIATKEARRAVHRLTKQRDAAAPRTRDEAMSLVKSDVAPPPHSQSV